MKSVWGAMRRNTGLVALSLFGVMSPLTGCGGGTPESTGNILLQDVHNYSAIGALFHPDRGDGPRDRSQRLLDGHHQ